MTYNGTLKIIDRLCEDHDIEILFWGDELKGKVQECIVSLASICTARDDDYIIILLHNRLHLTHHMCMVH